MASFSSVDAIFKYINKKAGNSRNVWNHLSDKEKKNLINETLSDRKNVPLEEIEKGLKQRLYYNDGKLKSRNYITRKYAKDENEFDFNRKQKRIQKSSIKDADNEGKFLNINQELEDEADKILLDNSNNELDNIISIENLNSKQKELYNLLSDKKKADIKSNLDEDFDENVFSILNNIENKDELSNLFDKLSIKSWNKDTGGDVDVISNYFRNNKNIDELENLLLEGVEEQSFNPLVNLLEEINKQTDVPINKAKQLRNSYLPDKNLETLMNDDRFINAIDDFVNNSSNADKYLLENNDMDYVLDEFIKYLRY